MTADDQKANRLYAMIQFVNAGYTPIQAAAIVGNLMQESGMDPGISQIGGGGGFGLAQWTWLPRKKALFAYLNSRDLPYSSLMGQLDFILIEMAEDSFKSSLRAFKEATTISLATMIFCNTYERPGVPHMAKRMQFAVAALNEWIDYKKEQTDEKA